MQQVPSFLLNLIISQSCFLDPSKICEAGKWLHLLVVSQMELERRWLFRLVPFIMSADSSSALSKGLLFFPHCISWSKKMHIHRHTCTYICNPLQQILLLLCPVNKAIPDNSPTYPVPFFPNHASAPVYLGSGNAFPRWTGCQESRGERWKYHIRLSSCY